MMVWDATLQSEMRKMEENYSRDRPPAFFGQMHTQLQELQYRQAATVERLSKIFMQLHGESLPFKESGASVQKSDGAVHATLLLIEDLRRQHEAISQATGAISNVLFGE